MVDLALVQSIAEGVRGWVEKLAVELDEQYSISITENGLCGMCAKASARLHKMFQAASIPTEIHIAKIPLGGHVYVLVDKEFIVDLTATQFDGLGQMDKVEIRHKDDPNAQKYCWVPGAMIVVSAEELRTIQQKNCWRSYQITEPKEWQ